MDKLRDYLKTMGFKKRAVGGLDEEDVLLHIKEICDLVQTEMEERDRSFEETTRKMQEELDAAREKLQQYRADYEKVQEANAKLDQRIQELRGEAARYRGAREQADRAQQEYDAKYQELMVAVDILHNVQKDAESKVRRELRDTLDKEVARSRSEMLAGIELERKSARQELEQLRGEIAALRRQKLALRDSMQREREQWKQHLDWFARRLSPEDDTDTWSLTDMDYGTNPDERF